MATWYLEPDLHGAFGISVVEPPKPTQRSPRQIVWVTRVGFNLWHTRASSHIPRVVANESLCIELGAGFTF